MKSVKTICLIAFMLTAIGCAANVSRHGYQIDSGKKILSCDTPIKLNASFDKKDVITLGSIEVSDGNLISKDCDEETVLNIVRQDSCQLAADVINLTEEIQPDYFFSVCYRIKADFLKFNIAPIGQAIVSDPQYEWEKVRERGAISRQRGAAAYGAAIGSGIAGGTGAGVAVK